MKRVRKRVKRQRPWRLPRKLYPYYIAGAVVILFVGIIGFTNTDFLGQAYFPDKQPLPSGYADPTGRLTITPDEFTEGQSATAHIVVSKPSGARSRTYKTVKYKRVGSSSWTSVTLDGARKGDWIDGEATLDLDTGSLEAGDYVLRVYSCTEDAKQVTVRGKTRNKKFWNCNNKKWIVQGFSVVAELTIADITSGGGVEGNYRVQGTGCRQEQVCSQVNCRNELVCKGGTCKDISRCDQQCNPTESCLVYTTSFAQEMTTDFDIDLGQGSAFADQVRPKLRSDENLKEFEVDARWAGFIWATLSGPHTFYIAASREATLYINSISIATSVGLQEASGIVDFVAGQHYLIEVEYKGKSDLPFSLSLSWSRPRRDREIIPISHLSRLDYSPIAHWTFESITNSETFDVVNSIKGTIADAYATPYGPSGMALGFGSATYIAADVPDISTVPGSAVTASFWMYWEGSATSIYIPIGFNGYDLVLDSSHIGFRTSGYDLYGTSSSSLHGRWTHITAVFTNGNVHANELYINGEKQSLRQVIEGGGLQSKTVSSRINIGGYATYRDNNCCRFDRGAIDEVKIFNERLPENFIEKLYVKPSNSPTDYRLALDRSFSIFPSYINSGLRGEYYKTCDYQALYEQLPHTTGVGCTKDGLEGDHCKYDPKSGSQYCTRLILTRPRHVSNRVDPTINFNWVDQSPMPSLDPDFFNVRWNGYIRPRYSEEYTFYTDTDDGVMLQISNNQLISDLTDGAKSKTGKIMLEASKKYYIQMDMYEAAGNAKAELSWSSQSQSKEIVPEGWLSTE